MYWLIFEYSPAFEYSININGKALQPGHKEN